MGSISAPSGSGARSVMRSHALLRLLVRSNSRYFVNAAFQAILDRDADDVGLEDYSAELRRTGDLAGVARSIARSEEAWNRNLYGNPTGVIEAAFRGVLGRDPEPAALVAYTKYLSDHKDLGALLTIVCQSPEHWHKMIADRAEDIVRAVFLGILGREPDTEALSVYATHLRQQRELA